MIQKLSAFVSVLGLMLLGYAGDGAGASNEWSTEAASLLTTAPRQADISYPVVDTGQELCYDDSGGAIDCPAAGEAFYGQDAQYDGVQPSYTDNGDGTVADNVTHLMWQQTPPTTRVNWSDATSYCSSLTLGGHTDWRLPDAKALFSISDFSSGWPYLNTDYFDLSGQDVSKDEQYWSSNYYLAAATPAMSDTAFGINHGTGHIKAYPALVSGGPGLKTVRCVRGDDYAVNDFVDNGDGTITDSAASLMWLQDDSGEGLDWESALAYADSSNYAGYDDWRVPNVKELQSIVDYSGVYPAIDQTYFNITDEDSYYWSSTSAYFSPQSPGYTYAWYVAFGYAVDAEGNDTHGAGAVRFDTKAEGGPAGEDPERIYNYFRLVRDVDQEPGSSYTVYLPLIVKQGIAEGNQNVLAMGEVNIPVSTWGDFPHRLSSYNDPNEGGVYAIVTEYEAASA
ncbi:MAG: DUF1566 domain-containing protein [Anaerolineae bacterium]|jgi:hypothetical protein